MWSQQLYWNLFFCFSMVTLCIFFIFKNHFILKRNPIMCGTTRFSNLPLWYAHYDGSPSFSGNSSLFLFFKNIIRSFFHILIYYNLLIFRLRSFWRMGTTSCKSFFSFKKNLISFFEKMKQYQGTTGICGTSIDLDFY